MELTLILAAVVALVIIVGIVLKVRSTRSKQLAEPSPAPPPKPAAPTRDAEPEAEPPAAREPGVVVPHPVELAESAAEEEQVIIETERGEEREATEQLEIARKERRLERLRRGLAPTRGGFITKIGDLFKGRKEIDGALLDDLEEVLITADVGAKTADWFINLVREALSRNEITDPEKVWELLRQEVARVIDIESKPFDFSSSNPYVIMVVGVNGVGKTTTIGKLATKFSEQGHKLVLAAGDTFRAAAVQQLEIWGDRSGAEVVKSKEGADPSSVVFDGIKRAKEIGADVVIADTAGRLHTKAPLMEELKKIGRVAGKAHEGAPHQVILVLDATTGQNATQQVALFNEALDLSGLVLTKLDGTAKGGVIIGICHEHKIPVRFIGIGEAKDDLREFIADDFTNALFYRDFE